MSDGVDCFQLILLTLKAGTTATLQGKAVLVINMFSPGMNHCKEREESRTWPEEELKVPQVSEKTIIRGHWSGKEEGSALQTDCWARGCVKEPNYGMH